MMENNSEKHNKNHCDSEIEMKKGTEMPMEGLAETENGTFLRFRRHLMIWSIILIQCAGFSFIRVSTRSR